VESGGGNPKADNKQGCYGIIQFCTTTGAAGVLKQFSKNGKDEETGITLATASDIKNQPLWRQLDYTYNYFSGWKNLLNKAERDSNGKILLSDFYLIILNPKSINIKGLNTDLQIPGKQAKLFYDCSLTTGSFPEESQNTKNSKCKTRSQNITFNQNSKSIIMGSSSVGTLNQVVGKIINAPTNSVDVSYNCEGVDIKFLINSLKDDTNVYKNVKTIYLAGIGTNDGYKDLGIKEFNDLVSQKFPNIKNKVILPGTYGWGSVENNSKTDQDNYYSIFVKNGWVYEYPNGVSAEFKSVGEAHNPKNDWFLKLTDLMKKYSTT
jgi:hypothetical protein